jgi:ABC-type sugar transport system substrate-binding protein
VVYGMADNQAAAIVQAAKAAGIPLGVEKGKLIIVGSNCLKQGIAGIKAGEQYSTGVQVPARTGNRAAELIADHFNGKTLPKKEILPVETITKANVAKWEEACTY